MTKLPDIETIKMFINDWAADYPRITKVSLYGSYVKKDKPTVDDIDIAIGISDDKSETAVVFMCDNRSSMQTQLCKGLNYKVHLEWFDGEETQTVKKGLEEAEIVVFNRSIGMTHLPDEEAI
jgi:predicted nucleotidyltransferase